MIDKDSYGLKKERNLLQEPYKEKENNSKNSDDISLMTNINKMQISWEILKNNFYQFWSKFCIYRKVASTNMRYQLKNQLFVKRSQYIRIENPLHKRSEKASICFNTRRASTRDYTVCRLKIGNFWPPPLLLVVFLLSKIGIFFIFETT